MKHGRSMALALLLATGCATIAPRDTPAQTLARQRIKDCARFPSVQVVEVDPDGALRVTTSGVSGVAEFPAWKACILEALAKQKKEDQVASDGQPAIIELHQQNR